MFRKPAPPPTGRHLADFAPLLPAEEVLRDACRKGGEAAFGAGERPEAATEENRIRAEVLRVFCLGLDPAAPVHEHGVRVQGAWIDGALDLGGCDLPRGIWIHRSHIVGDVVLHDAKAVQLGFDGSRCGGIVGDRLACRGGIFLRNGFVASREIRLLGANIGGNLECNNGAFETGQGNALSFDSAEISGSVFLNGGFTAKGTVRLLDAIIGGNLVCINGAFEAREGDALMGDRARISGNVSLGGGFTAKGTVSLQGATIGGDLECRSSRFEATTSLTLQKATINGAAFLDSGFHACRLVDLSSAEIDDLVDDEASWRKPMFVLDGLIYRRFAGMAPTSAARRICWLDQQPWGHLTEDFRPQPWEQCAKVLAEMGHERDAKIIRIEKRRRMRKLPWHRVRTGPAKTRMRRAWAILRKRRTRTTERLAARLTAQWVRALGAKASTVAAMIWDWIQDKTVGYGYRPWLAGVWLLVLWLGSGLCYDRLVPKGVMAPTEALVYLAPSIPSECRADWVDWTPPPGPDDLVRRAEEADHLGLHSADTTGHPILPTWKDICARSAPSEYSTFSPWVYTLDMLLPIVDLRQEHDWSPRVTDAEGHVIAPWWSGADWGWGYVVRLGEWLLILSGWGLSAMLVGAVTGIIRKE